MITTNLELLGEVGGGRPLQLCRWTYFAKSKSKQVIAKKRPKFNKKSFFFMQISRDVIGLKKSLSQAHKYQRGLNRLFLKPCPKVTKVSSIAIESYHVVRDRTKN